MVSGQPHLIMTKKVPQGFGPLLFTIKINSIITQAQTYNIHFYADDTHLYAHGSSAQSTTRLQCAFNALQTTLHNLKLELNANKTNVLLSIISLLHLSSCLHIMVQNLK